MRIKYEPSDGSMMMDLSTMQSLELIQNLQNARSKHCLFGLLDHTLTPMGARMLRSNILQPLTSKQTIEKRYDALEELTGHEVIYTAVRLGIFLTLLIESVTKYFLALKAFVDVDRVLTDIVIIPSKKSIRQWEVSINNVILVKQYVKSVPAVYDALEECRSELLRGIREVMTSDKISSCLTRIVLCARCVSRCCSAY